MLEVLTVLILYTQATLDDRFFLIFELYTDMTVEGVAPEVKDGTMSVTKMRFAMDQISQILAWTLSLRKNAIQEVLKNFMSFAMLANARVSKDEFVRFMGAAFDKMTDSISNL